MRNLDIPDLYKNITDNQPVIICVMDAVNKKVVYLNALAKKTFCCETGADFLDCISPNREFYNLFTSSFINNNSEFNTILNEHSYKIVIKDLMVDPDESNNEKNEFIVLYGIDLTDILDMQSSLYFDANIDSLTGIYNRKAGMQFLQSFLDEARISKSTFAICYLDLDDLKYVNDNFGHNLGDEYIITVVSAVKNSIRKTDVFSRLGGDEMLVIFPKCNQEVVKSIMNTLTKKLDYINDNEDREYKCSVSYGILEIDKDNLLSIDKVLDTVDSRMYEMKRIYKETIKNRH